MRNNMKLYVINLERAQARRERIQKNLKDLDLKFEFINAIDYKLTPKEVIDSFRTPLSQRSLWLKELTPGEIACFLSHRKAWQTLVDSEEEWALILEDDANVLKENKALITFTSWIPSGVELILCANSEGLAYCSVDRPILHTTYEQKDISLGKIFDQSHATSGAAAYFLHKRAAKRLLEQSNNFYIPADDFLFSRHSPARKACSAYFMSPCIAVPKDEVSFLQADKAIVKTPKTQAPFKYLFRTLHKWFYRMLTPLVSQRLYCKGPNIPN